MLKHGTQATSTVLLLTCFVAGYPEILPDANANAKRFEEDGCWRSETRGCGRGDSSGVEGTERRSRWTRRNEKRQKDDEQQITET
jgi:hypothetical protein